MNTIVEFHNILKKTNLTDITIKNYVDKYRILLELTGEPDMLNLILDLNNIELLEDQYTNPRTLKAYLSTILSYFKYAPDFDIQDQQILENLTINKAYVFDLVMTLSEEINDITKKRISNPEELILKIEKAKEETTDEWDLLVMSLFTEIEPMGTEYSEVEIIEDSLTTDLEEGNLLLMDKRKFVFNSHKDFYSQGVKIIDIPDNLYNIIRTNIDQYNLNNYLFDTIDNDHITENSFVKVVKRTFLRYGINITIRKLKKLYQQINS